MSLNKETGCCTLCGKPVFEVISRWGATGRLAGGVRRIGKPLKIARRNTIALMSGATCDITTCDRCEVNAHNMTNVWEICTKANARELDPKYREALGLVSIDPDIEQQYRNSICRIIADLPLFVVQRYSWEEYHDLTVPA